MMIILVTFNDGFNNGYTLHTFDIRYRKIFESAQPTKVEFKFSENIPRGIFGYSLPLTNKLVSMGSHGQRLFDSIEVIINFLFTLSFSFIVKSVFSSKDSFYLSGKLSMR